MKVCSLCGMINADAATECIECGTALQSNEASDSTPKMGLKLNLGDAPKPEPFAGNANAESMQNGTYVNSGMNNTYNSYGVQNNTNYENSSSVNNVGMNNSWNSVNNTNNSYSSDYVKPANKTGLNMAILGVLAVVVVLIGFLMLSNNKVDVDNTPKQAIEAYVDDLNDLELNHFEDYGCIELRDASEFAEFVSLTDEIKELKAKYPGMTIEYSVDSINGETELKGSEERRVRASLKNSGVKEKVGKIRKATCEIKCEISYKGESQAESREIPLYFFQNKGKWRVCGQE